MKPQGWLSPWMPTTTVPAALASSTVRALAGAGGDQRQGRGERRGEQEAPAGRAGQGATKHGFLLMLVIRLWSGSAGAARARIYRWARAIRISMRPPQSDSGQQSAK